MEVDALASSSTYIQKLAITIGFLLIFWFVVSYFISKFKTGQKKLPNFLINMMPALKNIDGASKEYNIRLIQKEALPDGTSLMVIDINGSRILASQHPTAGIRFLKDLDQSKASKTASEFTEEIFK